MSSTTGWMDQLVTLCSGISFTFYNVWLVTFSMFQALPILQATVMLRKASHLLTLLENILRH